MIRKLRLKEVKPLGRGHTAAELGTYPGLSVISETSLALSAPRASYVGHDLLILVPEVATVHCEAGPRGLPAGPTPQPEASVPANGAPGKGTSKPWHTWGGGVR